MKDKVELNPSFKKAGKIFEILSKAPKEEQDSKTREKGDVLLSITKKLTERFRKK